MKGTLVRNASTVLIVVAFALAPALPTYAQGKGGGPKAEKKVDKAAKKLGAQADKLGRRLGRDIVFCILEAHTDVGSAEELKEKFESLTDFPFGQFVAAVLLADLLDDPEFSLDFILAELASGKSLGQIARQTDENLGSLRRELAQFRRELARSLTNPPTRDCFATET